MCLYYKQWTPIAVVEHVNVKDLVIIYEIYVNDF